MTLHLSGKGWMSHMHHQHTMHMPHPILWLHMHPTVQALVLAGLIVLLIIGLGTLVGTGIRFNSFNGVSYPANYPFAPAY